MGWSLCLSAVAIAEITVRDFSGRQLTLQQPAQRIVALAPHIVENTFSAGAGSRLVGVVSYSNYPEAALDIPRVGDYHSWSLEQIVALDPDLVLMWGSGNGMESLYALERVGLPVYISEPRTLDDIADSIRAIAALAGTVQLGESRASQLQAGLADLRATYRQREPLSVFYQVWDEPLQTLNGQHLISSVIELCGGSNLYSDSELLAPQVSLESVLMRDPQVIVGSGMGSGRPPWLDDWRRYPSLTAVRNDALVFVHPDLIQRPTARILEGAQSLCKQMNLQRKGSSLRPVGG